MFDSSDVGNTYRVYIGNLSAPPGHKPGFFKQLFNLLEGCLDVQQQFSARQQEYDN